MKYFPTQKSDSTLALINTNKSQNACEKNVEFTKCHKFMLTTIIFFYAEFQYVQIRAAPLTHISSNLQRQEQLAEEKKVEKFETFLLLS